MSPTPIPGLTPVSEIFAYRGGELHAEGVPISRIAAAVGTPFYLYSAAGFTAQYRRFAEAFSPERPLICYAVKANSNLAVLRHMAFNLMQRDRSRVSLRNKFNLAAWKGGFLAELLSSI